ncbi:MFS transporter [Micromonospora tarensis]|uniref:MFS transporter n=1 Tax=Micromonospora tarensis TaxID=2806100 RepID=A0ABS1YDX9_9ACTN|nr:MFS transporter [Micromonospora tarensis]MBM0275416.1 MFS transporter [Micromonospora tarensis]
MTDADREAPASGPKPAWWLRPLVAALGGREATEGLWPLLGITMFATIATSAFYGYAGVWAVVELRATPGEVGWLLMLNALLSVVSGNVGGRISDRIGRRPVLVGCLGTLALLMMACAAVGDQKLLGFALVAAANTVSTPAWTARNAVVADVVGPERRAQAFSSLRVANNLAVVIGPALVGLVLLVANWSVAFLLLGAMGLGAAVFAQAVLPGSLGTPKAREARDRRRFGMLRDVPFTALLFSTLLSFMVYVAYTNVLPIVVVSTYDLGQSTWGFLSAINPVLVVLFQGLLTKRTAHVHDSWRIAVGVLLMGVPWLLLLLDHGLVMIVVVIVIFVVGEMLWAPASQAAASDRAPEHARGAYLGAYGATMTVAWAVGPMTSLALLERQGEDTMWVFLGLTGLVASVVGLIAVRTGRRESEATVPAKAPEPATMAAD